MNTNNPDLGDEDHVEVLVEDLFIEDYQTPLTLPSDHPDLNKRSRMDRVMKPLRGKSWPLLGGLAALGGLALATLLFRNGRRRKVSPLSRFLLRLGLAH
jgi:hypothetical protein